MKTSITITIVFFFTLPFMVSLFPADKSASISREKKKIIIENLLIGLDSDNIGLKTSSAYMLGELNADEAVIPLMNMLRSQVDESIRIVAALALYKIGNPKGIFAVKQAIKFDDSERVRKLCSNFYNDFQKNGDNSPFQVAVK